MVPFLESGCDAVVWQFDMKDSKVKYLAIVDVD